MRAQVYICDGCGAQKRETNRWYLAVAQMSNTSPSVRTLAIYEWTENHYEECKHYCGINCLQRALSAWNSEQTR